MTRACYPGSFDPVTLGHLDLIERAASFCQELVVAVIHNPNKNTMFNLEERKAMLSRSLLHLHNVRVDYFSGLLVDYLGQHKIPLVVRGLRDSSDTASELQMARLNRQMHPECDTLWLSSNLRYAHVSSSFVREIARLGGPIESMVSESVAAEVRQKVASRQAS